MNSARGFREYVRNKPGTAARAVDLIRARTGREGRVPASIGLYIVEKHRQKIQVSCVRVYILGNNDSDNRAQKKMTKGAKAAAVEKTKIYRRG